jgi:hypothetical protein
MKTMSTMWGPIGSLGRAGAIAPMHANFARSVPVE